MSSETQNTKVWFGISMVLIGVIVGFSAGKMLPGTAGPSPTPSVKNNPPVAGEPAADNAGDVKPVDKATDHIRGDVNAPISVITYSDFECPFCSRVHPTLNQLLTEYPGKVNLVFRHYPLGFHPQAQKAAEASECAAELGGNEAFWKLADMMFEKGADNTKLAGYAKDIGLNVTQFNTCLNSGKFAAKTAQQEQEGAAAGVEGTPGNIILKNGTTEAKLVSGAQPIGNFKTVIDGLLK